MMIKNAIEELTPRIIAWRRDIHQYPEAAWTEFRTAAVVINHLRSLGIPMRLGEQVVAAQERCGVPSADSLEKARCRAVMWGADPSVVSLMGDGFTGICAEIDCRQPGESGEGDEPLLAVRVDMDALPVQERHDEYHAPWRKGFASCHEGHMHACGHDGHVALGMGLAALLNDMRQHLRGRIRLVFQPAEESTLGARAMCAAGVMDGVDYLLGVHLGLTAEETGHVVCSASNFLATTKLDAHFRGHKSHAGAAPQEGRNALLAACSATLALHGLPRHGQGDTRVGVGTLECHGPRNVVPDYARLALETRGATGDLNAWLESEARRVLQEAGHLWNCEVAIDAVGHALHASGDMALARVVEAAANQCTAVRRVTLQRDLGASEDFSLLLHKVQNNNDKRGQGALVLLGCARSGGHHTASFDFDEAVLPVGLEVLARTITALLGRQL